MSFGSASQRVLKHKAVDSSAFYKPMVVQINGIFENYVRSLVEAVIEERFETVELYSDLTQRFRNDHIVHAAKILTHVKAGAIMGAPYNFDSLLLNLGKSLTNQKGYRLNPEIYTKLMGNCTSERLEKLFQSLLLPDPFSDRLGENTKLKEYFADKNKGRVAIRAKEYLDLKINLRNEIVHGVLTRAVDVTDLQETLRFFKALISALDGLLRE